MLADSNHTELFNVELGSGHLSTIILLHGLTSSHFEFTETGIAATLSSSYHVLVPDLPAHSGSLRCGPYTFDNIIRKLVSLITKHAKNGRVHVFGFSGGGSAALHLTRYHPELVETLCISGVQDQPSYVGYYTTFLFPFVSMIEKYGIPSSMLKKIHTRIGFTIPENAFRESRKNQTWNLISTACAQSRAMPLPPRSSTGEWELKTRCLALAAENQDHIKGVQELGRALSRGNSKSRTALIPKVPHCWHANRQALLVGIITAWIEEKELPQELMDLDAA